MKEELSMREHLRRQLCVEIESEKFIDRELDSLFCEADNDLKRPEGVHPGWWAVQRLLTRDYHGSLALLELPLRFQGDLKTIPTLTDIISKIPNPSRFCEYLLPMVLIDMESKYERFSIYTAEKGTFLRFIRHLHEIQSVLAHFQWPDRFPTPGSLLEGANKQ